MWWFLQAYDRTKRPTIALALFALGVGLEFMQMLVPYRTASGADALANAMGIGLGWVTGLFISTPFTRNFKEVGAG